MPRLPSHPIRIFLVALAFRLAFVAGFAGPNYYEGITASYVEALSNILDGRGMTVYVDVAPLSAPERDFRYEPFIDRPIGYVLLTLPAYAVWRSPVSIQFLHAILGALSCLLMLAVGRRVVSEKAAVWGAWLLALWPLSARFEIAVLPDSVMPFFLLLSTWLLLLARERGWAWEWSALTGLAIAASMTMRPDVMFLPVFLLVAIWLADRRWPSISSLAAVTAAIVLVIGLHTWRNYGATGGRILPLGLGNGISMWEGISQFGDTLGTLYGDTRLAEQEGYPTWAYPDGIDRDRARMREAVGIILDHPGFYAVHVLKRIPVLLTPDWIMSNRYAPSLMAHLKERDGHTIMSYVAAHPVAAAARAMVIVFQWATLVLAVLAMRGVGTRQLLWIPFAVIAYYIVVHLPTNTEARYLYPAIPFVLMLAAEALEILRSTIKYRAANAASL